MKTTPVPIGRYVVSVTGGVEMDIVGGPFVWNQDGQEKMIACLLDTIGACGYERECDSVFMICVEPGKGLSTSEFSAQFMDLVEALDEASTKKEKARIMEELA